MIQNANLIDSLKSIYVRVNDFDFMDDTSLLGGSLGKLLFIHEYERSFAVENPVAEKILLNTLSRTDSYSNLSLADGLAGFLRTVWILEDSNLCELPEKFYSQLDLVFETQLDRLISAGRHDLFYGSTGAAYYFLRRNKTKELEKIIDQMIKDATPFERGVAWESIAWTHDNLPIEIYELSLSHGCAAILVFLADSLTVASRIQDKIKTLIFQIIDFLLDRRSNTGISIYPGDIRKNGSSPGRNSQSRLAWCNGDLGISYALLKVATALGLTNLKQTATEDLLQTCTRTNFKDTDADESGLCHGFAGISLIYSRAYVLTKNKAFRDSQIYWLERAYDHHFERSTIDVSNYSKEEDHENYNLLNGICGVGLVFLDYINGSKSDWPKLFQI